MKEKKNLWALWQGGSPARVATKGMGPRMGVRHQNQELGLKANAKAQIQDFSQAEPNLSRYADCLRPNPHRTRTRNASK